MVSEEFIKAEIYRVLKMKNGRTFLGLSSVIYASPIMVHRVLRGEVEKGYIEAIPVRSGDGLEETYIYRIRNVLDPVYIIPKDWEWTLEAVGAGPVALPEEHLEPMARETVWRDQGDRGTCVGQGAGGVWDVNYLRLVPEDKPSTEDKAQWKKNVEYLGVLTDRLYPQSFSAEGMYQDSRKEGGITSPSGSSISAAARCWVKYGMAFDDLWPTSKSPKRVLKEPPDEKYREEAKNHTAKGYAQLVGWENIRQAIYTKGAVLGAFTVYENYNQMKGGDGEFPSPKGMIIGAHALALVGWDRRGLICLHSWGDWCGRLGRISLTYFQHAFMGAYVPLDDAEVSRLKNLYKVVSFTSNMEADWTLDEEPIGRTAPGAELKESLRKGSTHSVKVVPVQYPKDGQTVIFEVNNTDVPQLVRVTFIEPPPPSLWDRFFDAIASIWRWLTGQR